MSVFRQAVPQIVKVRITVGGLFLKNYTPVVLPLKKSDPKLGNRAEESGSSYSQIMGNCSSDCFLSSPIDSKRIGRALGLQLLFRTLLRNTLEGKKSRSDLFTSYLL